MATTLGGTALKPDGWDRSGCEAFQYFLYNPDTGAILSRTPSSWAKIIAFYCVYYTLLAAFWIACLNIFFMTLPDGHPKWTLDGSLIGGHPGVGMKPGMTTERVDSSLYVMAAGSEDEVPTNDDGEGDKNVDYAVRLQKFFERYDNTTGLVDCEDEPNEARSRDQDGCIFDTKVLDVCARFPYGYVVNLDTHNYAQPCMAIKLNKVFDWIPTPVKKEDLQNAEYELMSDNLKKRIEKSIDPNFVWIECNGRYPADREAIDEVIYHPINQGIALKYFPFRGGYYHQPLVSIKVKLRNDNSNMFNQLVHMECRAWYDGVEHSTKDMLGLVRFELMLEGRS